MPELRTGVQALALSGVLALPRPSPSGEAFSLLVSYIKTFPRLIAYYHTGQRSPKTGKDLMAVPENTSPDFRFLPCGINHTQAEVSPASSMLCQCGGLPAKAVSSFFADPPPPVSFSWRVTWPHLANSGPWEPVYIKGTPHLLIMPLTIRAQLVSLKSWSPPGKLRLASG